MNIAIVQQQLDISRGGAETATIEMARALWRRGLNVTVVTTHDTETALADAPERISPHGSDTAPAASDKVVQIHGVRPAGGSKVQQAVSFIDQADQYCNGRDFDVVLAITPCFSATVYQPRGGTYPETIRRSTAMVRSGFVRAVKQIGRAFNRKQQFFRLVEKNILEDRNGPTVACVSEYVRKQVALDYPPAAERARVVFNGVSIEPLKPEVAAEQRALQRARLGIEPEERVVLFVAHNFKLKGLSELLRACGEWRILVVGRDSARRYQQAADELELGERVLFLGPRSDMRGLYAAADVLAHPTWYDPCSRVVLEALACGLPAVTTWFNGAAEVIEAGVHGAVIANPGDTAALRAAVDECLESSVRAACAAAAPQMRERLSMDRHALELEALFREVRGDEGRRVG